MSQTTKHTGICGHCGCTVSAGTGTIRRWNGAARRHAPRYATKNAMGVITALHCTVCDNLYTKKEIKR